MSGIILIGDEQARQAHITSFVRTKNIPSYNIRTFDTKLKISEVREIIHQISFKDSKENKRLIVVNNSITIEAQNALLKTLEELSEDIVVFLCAESADQFLSTIISRCTITRLRATRQPVIVDDTLQLVVKQYMTATTENELLVSVLLLGQYVESQENGYKDMILALHTELKNSVNKRNIQLINKLISVIDTLNQEYGFVVKNNGNTRIVLENALLNSSIRK